MAQAKSYDCQIIRAVDGDTFEVLVNLGFDVFIHSHIRVKGINCQEMHDKDPAKRALALKAKMEAATLDNKAANITAWGRDKYGRMVADLSVEGFDYGKKMLNLGLAVPAQYELAEENKVPSTRYVNMAFNRGFFPNPSVAETVADGRGEVEKPLDEIV